MKKHLTICILSIFIGTILSAQENPKIKKDSFFASPMGLEDAKKSLAKGEHYYKKGVGLYDEALKYYMKAYRYNNRNAALNYKIAVCNLMGNNREDALEFLLNSTPSVAKDYFYLLGRAYQYNNQFDEAINAYRNYLQGCSKIDYANANKKVAQIIRECEFGKEMIKDTVAVFINNLGPIINTYYDDYNAMVSDKNQQIYFTSRRPRIEPKKRVSRFKFKEQIMSAEDGINQQCEKVWFEDDFSSVRNISLAGMSHNGERIYFYKGKRGNGMLYTAVLGSKGWTKVRKLKGGINHMAYREGALSIDADNNIYYVTNHRSGLGGSDIWMAQYKKKNRWHKPVNIGTPINTPFDEASVAVTPDGKTIFFASDGHLGMGGFDIYKSVKDAGGNWGEPQNLGFPINSPANELFYQPTSNPDVALYSTMRKGGHGGLDIYSIVNDNRQPFYYECSAIETDEMEPLNVSVTITDAAGNTLKTGEAQNSDLPFKCKFDDTGVYIVSVNREGYKSVTDTIECPPQKKQTVKKLFVLDKLRHPFTIAGTVTDTDKGTPLRAMVLLKDAGGNIIGKTNTSVLTGNYAFSLADKTDFKIEVSATDYYSAEKQINATKMGASEAREDFALKCSRVDYVVRGRITEEDQTTPLRAALIFYESGKREAETIVFSDSLSGNYNVTLKTNHSYMVEIEANMHFFVNDAVYFGVDQTLVVRNYSLKKMETGAKLVIENILFNSGKATLKPQSFEALDKFAELLQKNPTVSIEVSGHTDNTGSASLNKKLSKDRALTVKNYLVNKGIEDERITYAGYGFEQPIASNDTPEGREQNRRVEIKVIK